MHAMVVVEWGMLALGLFGLLTSSIFVGMVLVGAVAFRREAARQETLLQMEPEFLPAVTLFKPLHGTEAGLESNLHTFFRQDYLSHAAAAGLETDVHGVSRVEVLFCARTEDDAGLAIAHAVAAQYPHVTTRIVTSGEPWGANAKVCSLVAMAKVATHDLWVISDSDVRVSTDYLRRVVRPFAEKNVGCVTCLYRGVAAEGGLWSQLEAVGMTVEMSSGACVANLMEPMQFALGPTMIARRECVAEIGGFEAMVEYCADDFVLGNWIAAKGHTVVLSEHVIDHMVLHTGFLDSIRHQVRWMKSTRFSRPKGHLGTGLMFGIPYGLLVWVAALLLGYSALAWGALAVALLGRCVQAWVVGKSVVRVRRTWPVMLLFPIRDLMGMLFWALSFGSRRILWRGELYELIEGGRMRKAGASA